MADNRKSNYFFAEWRNELHYTEEKKELHVHEMVIGLLGAHISTSDRSRLNSATWKTKTEKKC